jgi:hypothetical protein
MSDNVAPQSRCHLLGLPSEIRLLIYEELFPPRRIDMTDKKLGLDTAILATCRTIHKEAKPVLYENTEFEITLHAEGEYVGPYYKNSDNAKRIWPLFNLARKLSLNIILGASRKRMLKEMASELTRLDEASHLKKLDITFKSCRERRPIQWQFDLVVGVLGLVALPAGVTVKLDVSLTCSSDFQLPKFFESLDKLDWSVQDTPTFFVNQTLT